MTEWRLTPSPLILESRQQQFVVRLPYATSGTLMVVYKDPSSGTPICRVVEIDHRQRRTAEDLTWPAPGEEPVVKTIIYNDKSTAKRATHRWVGEKEVKVWAGDWMWWTDGSHMDDSQVGAAEVCYHLNECRIHRSYLGTGWMEVVDTMRWAIGLMLRVTAKRRDRLQKHGVTMVVVCSDSEAANW